MVLAAAVIAAMPVAESAGAMVDEYWNGGTGTWTDAFKWNTPWPGGDSTGVMYDNMYPDNTPETTFNTLLYGGGTCTLDGRDVTIDQFMVGNNTTLTGNGNITVLKDFSWQGGTMAGTGAVTVNGNVVVSSTFQFARFLNRPLNTYGASSVAYGVYLSGPTGAWHNYGSFSLDKGAPINASGGTPTFYNHGTFTKTGTETSYVYTNFENAGTASVNAGTLSIQGGLTNTGTIDVAAGAKLSFNNGSGSAVESHAAGSRITGAGEVEFLGGTHVLASYEATGPVTFGIGTVMFNNTIQPSSLGDLKGTVNFNAAQSFADVKLTGVAMGGAGAVEVTHQFTWLNGEMNGAGTTSIAAGAALGLSGTNSALSLSRVLTNYGTTTHGGVAVKFNNSGTFTNAGTFNATGVGGFVYGSTYGAGKFTNASVFRKSGTGSYKIDGVTFDNAGAVYVDQGTLDLTTPFTNSGSVQLAAGTTLKLSGNTFTGQVGSSLGGPGAVQVTGGNHAFADGGAFAVAGPVSVTGGALTLNGPFTSDADFTLNGAASTVAFNGATTFKNFVLTSGAVGGTGAITVKGNAAWTTGNFQAGGPLLFAEGSALTLGGTFSGVFSVARPVETRGTVSWTSGQIAFNGATWDNYGSMSVGDVTTLSRAGGASNAFRNYGVITKTGSTTVTSDTLVNVQNYGTINVNGGGWNLRDGAINAGTINVGAGATLTLGPSGFTNQPGSKITGDGTVTFNSGTATLAAGTFDPRGTVLFPYGATVNINDAIHPATLGSIDGSVNFNVDQSFASVTLNGSSQLGGTGTVAVSNAFTWAGGSSVINSAVTLAAAVTWDVATVGNRTLNGSLTVNGTAHLTTGSFFFNGGSRLTNNGTVDVSAAGFSYGGAGGAAFDNAGILRKITTGSVTLPSGLTLNNTGTLDVQAGTLAMYNAPAQHTGATLAGGTWTVRDGATLTLSGGSNITTNAATINLYGPTSKFDKINFLTTNNGSLSFLDGRSFATPAGSAFTNAGTLTVRGGGTFTATAAAAGAGNVTVGAGSTLAIKGGWNQTGGVWAIDGTVTHSGGTSSISAGTSQRWTDGSALNVTGGTLTLASDAGGYFPNFTLAATVGGTAATLQSSATQRLKSLSVGTGGTVTLLSGTGATLFTHSLTLTGTGKLDLNDNKLIVDDDPAGGSPTLAALRQALWAGNLMSTSAGADAQHRMAIGYADASDLGVTSWGGLLIYPATAVAKVTWLGDANLDGKVDADDYALADRGLARSLTNAHWTDGDFNYDGLVNAADYLLLDRVFVQSNGGVASPQMLSDREARFGSAYVAELVTAVPEPGIVGAAALLGLFGRRRRR